jgi:hypothetical protein
MLSSGIIQIVGSTPSSPPDYAERGLGVPLTANNQRVNWA